MANIGWVGLGKLGLPCALALGNEGGHHIYGYDVAPNTDSRVKVKNPYESGLDELSRDCLTVCFGRQQLVEMCDIVFCAVQTPHDSEYGGEVPMPTEKKDFSYNTLAAAVGPIASEAKRIKKHITLVVISTVLPGTMDRVVKPNLNEYVTLIYNPFFIAMGTTIKDFLNPEFVLIGVDNVEDATPLTELYSTIHSRSCQVMSIQSAELTKVAYNCFISMKVVFGNTVMEICDKTGADCDEVVDALSLATDRVVSPAYLRGGMGDGGSCHPRDNIAMSWLADNLELSADPFLFVSLARESQAKALADRLAYTHRSAELPVVIMGKSYKPESNLINGSPAILVAHYLNEAGIEFDHYDHHVDVATKLPEAASVVLVGTKHDYYRTLQFPSGSIVLDPFGYIEDQEGVQVIRVGRK